jgi:hypothetical protein
MRCCLSASESLVFSEDSNLGSLEERVDLRTDPTTVAGHEALLTLARLMGRQAAEAAWATALTFNPEQGEEP